MKTLPLAIAIAIALALPAPLLAATHTVTQVGLTFSPDDLTIDVGDTVEWIWTVGIHTVTEGTDDNTPPIGDKLFDMPLEAATPTQSFTFTELGDVAYYCRPHRTFGMVAVIRVQAPTPTSELDSESWARVKILYR